LSDTVRSVTARTASRPTRRLGGTDVLRQAIRMTARDWRAGELTMLLLALVLAVAAFWLTACIKGSSVMRGA
jgi:putative ABC transport system permease protein